MFSEGVAHSINVGLKRNTRNRIYRARFSAVPETPETTRAGCAEGLSAEVVPVGASAQLLAKFFVVVDVKEYRRSFAVQDVPALALFYSASITARIFAF